ncbi:MAG: hypothetical protein IT330_13205 [Anaerolineae bacterium]|nr:hypothetical protein [Anaerolineae bacterium]
MTSWVKALEDGTLTKEQREVLDEMVQSGECRSLEEAARQLDWKTALLEQQDSMYGPAR